MESERRLAVDNGFNAAIQKNFTGGRCDFYLKIKRCLKRHNSEIFCLF